MIDPSNITNFNQTDYQLEEVLIFWICVAGKTATVISRNLDRLLESLVGRSPFDKIRRIGAKKLPQTLKDFGIGCYNMKAKTIWGVINSGLDLRTCSIEDLERIAGIGRKTSRCFVMHSRPDAECAGLDVHILKFLREQGHDVPKSTPGTDKAYKSIEKLFLKYANKSGKTVADFDLKIWKKHAYNGGKNV